tara:strand:- start:51 stop:431 length:381 start_codon:yes stop_codon:yes gene_type:complete
MKFKNECNHPEEDYLFTMDIEGETFDVWYYRHSLGDKNEFCLRYGNEDHEYKSSWDCAWIERSICHHSKFADDYPGSAIARDQFIDLKRRLQDAGFWDLEWNLDSEIRDLRVDVEQYNNSPRFKTV